MTRHLAGFFVLKKFKLKFKQNLNLLLFLFIWLHSSSSSSSDDTEPAAYRRKRYTAIDDGLPTEGIPLSPEAAVEDVSSDEQDDPAVGNVSVRILETIIIQFTIFTIYNFWKKNDSTSHGF